jgi:hypothetical protein
MKKIYEIWEQNGFSDYESVGKTEWGLGLIFSNKEEAEKEAHKLLMKNTTEADRKSGWHNHWFVKEIEIK